MRCPKCSAAMQAVTYQGIEVDRCSQCGDVWFDLLEAEDLKQLSGSECIDTGTVAAGMAQNRIGHIRCPRDTSAMLRMVVHGQPHIWYEMCPICHGTYFDAGEFRDFKSESWIDLLRAVFRNARP